MASILDHAKVVTPTAVIPSASVLVDDEGRIVYVGSIVDAPHIEGERFDMAGCILAPGFIDIHVHGGIGITFGNLETLVDDVRAYSAWIVKTGVTGFLCSVAVPDRETLLETVTAYADILDAGNFPGAIPLGLHLEGPYLNPEKKGAFNVAWLREPAPDEVRALLDAGRGWIRQMTLAPELPLAQDVAALLRESGVVAAIGHTNLDYAAACAALRCDFTHVTHTFNAQRGFHHREPGALGAVLASDEVSAELIADTIHVHPGAMKVMLRCLGADRVVLVTDAMAAAGLGDGVYHLTGHEVIVEGGVARQVNGTIAGSTTTLNQCVRNVHQKVGVSLADAISMASYTPAQAMGLSERLGSLEIGKDANLVVLDEELNVKLTLVRGNVVFRDAA